MTTQALQFVGLSDRERKQVAGLPKVSRGDMLELRVRRRTGRHDKMSLPPRAAALVQEIIEHLVRGEKVAVLAEDKEISPNDAAAILGMSRPLVVHRMEVGDLPFRYVGKHRRARLTDVLALKRKLDKQQAALDALAEETEGLMRDHGL